MTAPIRHELRPTRSTGSVVMAEASETYGMVTSE